MLRMIAIASLILTVIVVNSQVAIADNATTVLVNADNLGNHQEATNKKVALENSIREGMIAICLELVEHVWIESSEQCADLDVIAYNRGLWGTTPGTRRNEP